MRIVREGWPFILGCLVATDLFLLGVIFYKSRTCAVLAVLCFIATAFCGYFFRDPARIIPPGDRLFLSPADGRILDVVDGHEKVLRIFLSVFDVHLQRSPMSGTVTSIRYQKGKFLDARDPRAPFENEQNHIEIATDKGPKIVVTQIAGLIARRIVCWVKEGQKIKAGDQIGLIRFGSQVDVIMPKNALVKVKAGDKVVGGETVLAELP